MKKFLLVLFVIVCLPVNSQEQVIQDEHPFKEFFGGFFGAIIQNLNNNAVTNIRNNGIKYEDTQKNHSEQMYLIIPSNNSALMIPMD